MYKLGAASIIISPYVENRFHQDKYFFFPISEKFNFSFYYGSPTWLAIGKYVSVVE